MSSIKLQWSKLPQGLFCLLLASGLAVAQSVTPRFTEKDTVFVSAQWWTADKVIKVHLLADPKALKFSQTDGKLVVRLPDKAPSELASVIRLDVSGNN